MFQRLTLAAVLTVLGATELSAQPAPPAAPHMTTPTPAYCTHLNGEIERAQGRGATLEGHARYLAAEGARMCDRGQYRGGVVRLRRALNIMRNGR